MGTRKSAENERKEHVSHIKQGAKGYAVLCVSTAPDVYQREIDSYVQDELLVIDSIVDHSDGAYAVISGTLPVDSIRERPAAWSDEARDIEQVRRDPNLTRTERDALIAARMGQGRFRQEVLDRWGRACALTGCSFEPLLRASHIKPWSQSDSSERLDPNNGLPLVAHVDVLFDRGFITFDVDGSLSVAPDLPDDALAMIGKARTLLHPLAEEQKAFLVFHRNSIFNTMKPEIKRRSRRAPNDIAEE